MDISIIMIHYQTLDYSTKCIESIINNTKNIKYEIILVDNSIADGTGRRIKNKFPQLKYIENETNVGFGEANNKAINYAESDNILFINSDIVINDNAIKKCYDKFISDKNTGALGAKLVRPSGEVEQSWDNHYHISSFKKNIFLNPILHKLNNKSNVTSTINCVSAAFLITKKSILDAVGKFDTDFFLYFEDIDLCRRIQKYGYKIVYYDNVSVTHMGSKSSKSNPEKQLNSSMYLYILKARGKTLYIMRLLVDFVNYFTLLLLYPFVSKENKKYFSKTADKINPFNKWRYIILFRYSSKQSSAKQKLIVA